MSDVNGVSRRRQWRWLARVLAVLPGCGALAACANNSAGDLSSSGRAESVREVEADNRTPDKKIPLR